MQQNIRLVLVDDHGIFLEGLVNLLNEDWITIEHTASDGIEALEVLQSTAPDILITDLSMPEMGGVELVKEVKRLYPDIKILVLTMHNDKPTISEIVMAEAEGYLLKNSSKKDLIKAIQRIADGDTCYSNEVMEVILKRTQRELEQRKMEVALSDREKEVLQLIAMEKSSEEIAQDLFISRRTVETHRRNLLKKTDKRTVVGLLKYSYQTGIIDWK